MKFRLYTEYGALNSPPIFQALADGIKNLGYSVTDNEGDIGVIWSVLWNGRMRPNREIYYRYLQNKKPILIIEVGNLKRNHTWRLSLNHVNSLGYFGNDKNLDASRSNKLQLNLEPVKHNRKDHILIACQHQQSLQWENTPETKKWVTEKITQLRKYTDRKIIIRPHPRSRFDISGLSSMLNVEVENPIKIASTYDDFNINYNCHAVINHNSGPSIQALIKGVPVVCDESSLAYPLSSKLEEVESCKVGERDDWFLKLCHTEWTIDEIKTGIPLQRLL